MTNHINFIKHNKGAWDRQALAQNEWSKAVTTDLVERAKQGDWDVYLTPTALDKKWLGEIKGKRVLCLASAGGQQGPILSAAGAEVVVYDLSQEQLNQDEMVAKRDNLSLSTIQGDMTDLSCFEDNSFDLIFHPISNHYVSDVNLVWKESHRVLKKGGALLSSFFNPVVFVGDRNPSDRLNGVIRPKYHLPYADIVDLDKEEIEAKIAKGEALVFGHTLSDLIGGQLRAGFMMTDYWEEMQPNPRFLIDEYLPTFIATRCIKI